MSSFDGWLRATTVQDLLAHYASIEEELRRRKITRTANNPVGDYAQSLYASAFHWKLQGSSNMGFSAEDGQGIRYKISSRRIAPHNESRQLGALRDLDKSPFSYLAGVIFETDFSVLRAAIVPYETVWGRARFSKHVNAWLFNLDDDVWSVPNVTDTTAVLVSAAVKLNGDLVP